FLHVSRKDNDEREGEHTETCFKGRKSSEIPRKNFHARQKFPRNSINFESEEILDLRAGDDYGNSICESHYHGPRNEFYCAAEPGDSENHQQRPCHQRAHVQTVEAVPCHDTVYNHHK